jgi:type IV secretory pathway TraG/TraD family ATPase VirD4
MAISAVFLSPISNHVFFLHVSLLIALIVETILNNSLDIEPLMSKKRKPRTIRVNDFTNQTVIGYKGSKEIASADNARHIFVCGTTGSGKTVLLANYIESAIEKNYPLLIIDGKGDTGKGSILEIVQRFRGDRKLYVVNMSDISLSSHYNPFKDATATIVKDMLTNLTEWSEEHYKSNTERYVQRLVYLLELHNKKLSFEILLEYFSPDALTELSMQAAKSNLITKAEHLHTLEIIKACSTIAVNASARFTTIAESDVGKIFDKDGIDIYSALEQNAIILFVLNPLIYPETTAMLGRLAIIDAKKAVSKLYTASKGRVFFLFDEINTFASPTLIDLFNKSRSADVTCIAATQSLSDLDFACGEAFREQIIENCNNYIVSRQNSAKNAEEWSKIFGTVEGLSVTYQLGNDKNNMTATGMGSARKERKFIYHPDEIKRLKTGEAIFMSKDTDEHSRIRVRKGF